MPDGKRFGLAQAHQNEAEGLIGVEVGEENAVERATDTGADAFTPTSRSFVLREDVCASNAPADTASSPVPR